MYIYIYMDAYMFVSLGHVLFFLNNKEHGMANYPTWNTHLSPLTSVMSPRQLPPQPLICHLSLLTSHVSPLTPPCLSTLTSHVSRSPLTSHNPLSLSPPTLTRTLTLSNRVAHALSLSLWLSHSHWHRLSISLPFWHWLWHTPWSSHQMPYFVR